MAEVEGAVEDSGWAVGRLGLGAWDGEGLGQGWVPGVGQEPDRDAEKA